ncbi:hypothetical protein ACQ4PT_019554 [Festuca glaucescens]
MGGGSEGGADGDESCCSVGDTSPGTIVWVRRRNGSWWPGRILGQDELPPSQIMSPRSGTPVKLLGREDASVDWYNLEKSKRVKAFRCGEFDACIERAEATQGTLAKKREKYARREDAILHALELERKLLASKHQIQGFRPAYFSACTRHRQDLGSTRYKSKKRKRKNVSTLPAKEDDEQYFPHVGSKINFSESIAQGTSKNLISNDMGDLSHVRRIQGGASLESKEKYTVVKKNRSDGSDFDESIEKCDRHRPLVQVMQSSAKLSQHSQHIDDYGSILIGGDKDPSPATYRTKRSRYAYLPSDSGETHSHSDLPSAQVASRGADFETESYLQHPDSSSDEHTSSDFVGKHVSESSERECSESETEDDAELLQSANMILPPELRPRDPYFLRTSDKFGHVDNDDYDDDEVPYSTYMHLLNQSEEEDGSSELGVSRWHIKGKRNNRNAVKRSIHMTYGSSCLDKPNGLRKGSMYKANGTNHRKGNVQTSNQQLIRKHIKEEPNCDSDETDLFEDTNHPEVNLYHSRTYPSSLKATRDLSRSYIYFNDYEHDSSKISPLNWDTDQIFRVDGNAYWDEPSFYQRSYNSRLGGMGPMLFDIDLKVQASYHGEHVPLVSLMSRLDGKAIVGHPIQIEKLVDGSTDHLVSGGDISMEENTGAPPAWRTGRRTAMQRVPRSNPSGASTDGGNEGGLAYPDWEMKPVFRKYSTPVNYQVKADKESMPNNRRSSTSKSQKKQSKNASLSSQKVRTLSSISTGRRRHEGGGQAKAHSRSGILGGLIKPEGAIPLVTCVPAKVVFTRILEAVGRPPLTIAHHVKNV